jgi:hypothetical protein
VEERKRNKIGGKTMIVRSYAAEKIFEDIDEAIRKCLHDKPTLWNKSQFKKYYEKLKKKWNIKDEKS